MLQHYNQTKMKIILDITENNRIPFFMELIRSLGYIRVVKEIKDDEKSRYINELEESFNDITLHKEGKKKLKSAKDLLNEL